MEPWVEQTGKAAFESIEEMVRALDFGTFAEDYAAGLDHAQALAKLIEVRNLDADDDADEIQELAEAAEDELRERLTEELTENDLEWHEEDARQAIDEDPLSIQVHSGWYSPGEEPPAPEEFEILLSTGGPATRLIGELDDFNQPFRVRLEVQDWFKPWTEYPCDEAVLLRYAQTFYYGE